MRKLVVGTFLTLHGVMQAPGGPDEDRDGWFEHGGWGVPQFDETMGKIMSDWMSQAGAFLLGRRKYQIHGTPGTGRRRSGRRVSNQPIT